MATAAVACMHDRRCSSSACTRVHACTLRSGVRARITCGGAKFEFVHDETEVVRVAQSDFVRSLPIAQKMAMLRLPSDWGTTVFAASEHGVGSDNPLTPGQSSKVAQLIEAS